MKKYIIIKLYKLILRIYSYMQKHGYELDDEDNDYVMKAQRGIAELEQEK